MASNIEQQVKTVRIMIDMYCRAHHEGPHPCAECRELADYAEQRTRRCPRGEQKGNCDSCTIRGYKPEMREKVRAAMRWAGPRMLFTHPVMAVRHLVKKIKAKRSAKMGAGDAKQ